MQPAGRRCGQQGRRPCCGGRPAAGGNCWACYPGAVSRRSAVFAVRPPV